LDLNVGGRSQFLFIPEGCRAEVIISGIVWIWSCRTLWIRGQQTRSQSSIAAEIGSTRTLPRLRPVPDACIYFGDCRPGEVSHSFM
jgi:hypothetical protein